MSTIAARFDALKAKGEKALICYFTAGDPSLEALPEIIITLEEAGAEVI